MKGRRRSIKNGRGDAMEGRGRSITKGRGRSFMKGRGSSIMKCRCWTPQLYRYI